MVEKNPFLKMEVSTIPVWSGGKITETLKASFNDISGKVLEPALSNTTRRYDRNYVDCTFILTVRLEGLVTTAMHCPVMNKDCGG